MMDAATLDTVSEPKQRTFEQQRTRQEILFHFPPRVAVNEERLHMIFDVLLQRGYRQWLESPGLFKKHVKLLYDLLDKTQWQMECGGERK